MFPRVLRQKWLKKLRHHKVMLAISSSTSGNVLLEAEIEMEVEAGLAGAPTKATMRPFPRKKGAKSRKMEEEEEQDMGAELAKQALGVITRPGKINTFYNNLLLLLLIIANFTLSFVSDGEPMRPSEIIAAALSSGELSAQDVVPEVPEAPESEGNGLPDVPSAAADQAAVAVLPPAVPKLDTPLPDIEKASESDDEGNESDSDKDSDYEPDESAEKNDAEEEEVGVFTFTLRTFCLFSINTNNTFDL